MTTVKKPLSKTPAIRPIANALTKSGLIAHLVADTGVASKDVRALLISLERAITGSLHKKGAGHFTLPGLLKITTQAVPAKPKRHGVDPFTKEERWFAAKPATKKMKLRALKKLKDAAS